MSGVTNCCSKFGKHGTRVYLNQKKSAGLDSGQTRIFPGNPSRLRSDHDPASKIRNGQIHAFRYKESEKIKLNLKVI